MKISKSVSQILIILSLVVSATLTSANAQYEQTEYDVSAESEADPSRMPNSEEEYPAPMEVPDYQVEEQPVSNDLESDNY